MKIKNQYEENGYIITEYDNGTIVTELKSEPVEEEIDILKHSKEDEYLIELRYIRHLQEIQLGIDSQDNYKSKSNKIYLILKKIISNNNYDKEDIKNKIDIFFIKNEILEDEYNELLSLIENNN